MSTTDGSDNLSDWTADQDHEELLNERRRNKELRILYDKSVKALSNKEGEVKKAELEICNLRMENKELRRKRDNRNREVGKTCGCAMVNKREDGRYLDLFGLLFWFFLGAFAAYMFLTATPLEISKTPWMYAQWKGMDTQHSKWKGATSQLFHRMLSMDKISNRHELIDEIRTLEEVYWNVSKHMKECSEQAKQTIEFHLQGMPNKDQAKGDKKGDDSEEKVQKKKEQEVKTSKEESTKKEKSENQWGEEMKTIRSVCDEPELMEIVRRAAASAKNSEEKETEIEKQIEEMFGRKFDAWVRVDDIDVVIYITYTEGGQRKKCQKTIAHGRDD